MAELPTGTVTFLFTDIEGGLATDARGPVVSHTGPVAANVAIRRPR